MDHQTKVYRVRLTPGEDGWVVATCPSFTGCISQGRNRDEALTNIREAIELSLEEQDQGSGANEEWVDFVAALD